MIANRTVLSNVGVEVDTNHPLKYGTNEARTPYLGEKFGRFIPDSPSAFATVNDDKVTKFDSLVKTPRQVVGQES